MKMKVQADKVPLRWSVFTLTLPRRVFVLSLLMSVFVVASFADSAALADDSPVPLTDAEKSLCGKKLAVTTCMMKLSACAPLDALLAPLLGDPHTILSCANTTNITFKSDFLAYLGRAMMTGTVDMKLPKKPTDDPLTNYAIRRCILNSTGMLGDNLQLNRDAIAGQVAALSPPSLAAAVALAVVACPEPVELKVKDYLKCLKKTCVASVPDPTSVPPSFGGPFSSKAKSGASSSSSSSDPVRSFGGWGGMGTI